MKHVIVVMFSFGCMTVAHAENSVKKSFERAGSEISQALLGYDKEGKEIYGYKTKADAKAALEEAGRSMYKLLPKNW